MLIVHQVGLRMTECEARRFVGYIRRLCLEADEVLEIINNTSKTLLQISMRTVENVVNVDVRRESICSTSGQILHLQ